MRDRLSSDLCDVVFYFAFDAGCSDSRAAFDATPSHQSLLFQAA
jgi:hypothetical protein